jgi:alkanesulfonate monooxygenase SsuD/methylene tetrahydromethanopterin reductase-like flavin-dependent oxidoreductase (luciferase family)
VAGAVADGTILWMGNARAIESHVAPRIGKAAADAGRPSPRIVAGLPVAVHDDVDEARAVAARQFAIYGQLPNYQRILEHGGVAGPAEASIVGDEASVTDQLEALVAAGATDIWAAVFPVGDDAAGSRQRTRALLRELATP